MIFFCTRGALYNMDDLFSFAPQYLQWAGVAPADMVQRRNSPNTVVKIWTNEGVKTISAILRPQLTVTCNILETSCMKRTKNHQQNDKSEFIIHLFHKITASMTWNDWDHEGAIDMCVSALERWRQLHVKMFTFNFNSHVSE